RVFAMTCHAQVYGFHTLQDQERIERRKACAHVAQVLQTNLESKSNIGSSSRRECLECIPVHQTMIAWVRIGKVRETAAAPVKVTTVDDHSTDRVTVSAEILGGAVYHD